MVQLTKTRSGPPRTVSYSFLQGDGDICPVTNLHQYIEMTSPLMQWASPDLCSSHPRNPLKCTSCHYIGHWIKDTLKVAGVDTERFTAHSTRGASTSRALARGVPIAEILKVANWSSTSTFERFYHHQPKVSTFARAVLHDSRYVITLSCVL